MGAEGETHWDESCKLGFSWPGQACYFPEGLCTCPSKYWDVIHIKSVQFSGFQYIHKVVQLSSSNLRIFLSHQKTNKKSLKKNEVGGIGVIDFKHFYITTPVRTVVWREEWTRGSIEQNGEQRDWSAQISPNELWQICKSDAMKEKELFQQMVLEQWVKHP